MHPEVRSFIDERKTEFARIPEERKEALRRISRYVEACRAAERPARLTFICTHNSRRSHLCQIWARIAAEHFGLDHVHTYSGGTEATAFDPRAVAALDRAGLRIEESGKGTNPVRLVSYAPDRPPLAAFSKVYDRAGNPRRGFAAVLTCAQADEACPIVEGAEARISIPYLDPKAFDDTPEEGAGYDERCRQIAREMLFAMSEVR